MDGTFSFLYSGVAGSGIGIFTVSDGRLTGSDASGGKYSGHVIAEQSGNIRIDYEAFVPVGLFIVSGISEQDIPYKQSVSITLPPNYGNGEPQKVIVGPGPINVIIQRLPDSLANYTIRAELIPPSK